MNVYHLAIFNEGFKVIAESEEEAIRLGYEYYNAKSSRRWLEWEQQCRVRKVTPLYKGVFGDPKFLRDKE